MPQVVGYTSTRYWCVEADGVLRLTREQAVRSDLFGRCVACKMAPRETPTKSSKLGSDPREQKTNPDPVLMLPWDGKY